MLFHLSNSKKLSKTINLRNLLSWADNLIFQILQKRHSFIHLSIHSIIFIFSLSPNPLPLPPFSHVLKLNKQKHKNKI